MEERLRASAEKLEQIARWGSLHDATRPADPKRNFYGFTEGDRFRYRVIDRVRRDEQTEYGWRIDRVTDDGEMIVNGGAVRLNGQGQVIFQKDSRTGIWTEWAPPLAILEPGLAVGQRKEVSGVMKVGAGNGVTSTIRLSGSMHVAVNERVTTPAGTFDTVRFDVSVSGSGRDSAAPSGWISASVRHRIWYAWRVGVWVAWEEERRENGRRVEAVTRELTAYDMASAPHGSQLAGATR